MAKSCGILSRALEFSAALAQRHTYSPCENTYVIFGFLWGLPVPMVALALDISARGLAASTALAFVASHPIHVIFLLHPLLFAVVFGALGTMAHERDERIQSLVERLSNEARRDGLTGLLNHRAFFDELHREVERSRRTDEPLACLMIDVDHFKRVNDRWGHLTGDAVLLGLAQRIAHGRRPYDAIARFGGEEFAILLPSTSGPSARTHAERIRREIEAAAFEAPGEAPLQRVTVSIGVAALPEDADSGGALLDAADRAMYAAKEAGRNRVCLARRLPCRARE